MTEFSEKEEEMKACRWRTAGAVAFGLAVAASAPASAQRVHGEVSLMSGGTFFLVDPPATFAIHRQDAQPLIVQNGVFKDALGVGVNAGARIGDRVSVEGMFWWVPTELSASDGLFGTRPSR